MATPDDDLTEDRRTEPCGPNRGRRWDDDPHQAEMFEWAKRDLGQRLFLLRDDLGWSLEKVARAVRMKAETIADLENGRGDPKFSSITRLNAFYGRYTRVLPERRDNIPPAERTAPSRPRGVNRALQPASP